MQRFRDQNDFINMPIADGIVQCAHRRNAQLVQPVGILAEGLQQVGVTGHRHQAIGVLPAREAHNESILEQSQAEPLEVTR